MATWNSRGLRGSTLEDLVNRTNEQYAEKNLALIQKIPTPITPVRMDKKTVISHSHTLSKRSTRRLYRCCSGNPGLL